MVNDTLPCEIPPPPRVPRFSEPLSPVNEWCYVVGGAFAFALLLAVFDASDYAVIAGAVCAGLHLSGRWSRTC